MILCYNLQFLFLVESHSVPDNTAPVTDPSVEPVPLLSQSVTDTAISDITGTVDMMTTLTTGTQVDMSLNEETCSDMLTTTSTAGTQVDMSLNVNLKKIGVNSKCF